MDVAYRTEVGHVRSRNEDALLARPERGLLAVADGLGGHPAGDVASLTALTSVDGSGLSAVTEDHGMHGYLTQALGLDRDVRPDVAEVDCPPGSRLLLCTDGLTNMVGDDALAELLGRGTVQEAVDGLVEAALDAGGVDNVTVVVVAF